MSRAHHLGQLQPVVAIAAAWWLFTDLAAVWGPSLITVFGQAAATPAELMGAFALGCVLAAYPVLALARTWPWAALLVALGARVVLAFGPGGQVQLWAASAGVAAALAWLGLLVARSGRGAAPGVALGWVAHTTAAALGGTWLAVWRTDALAVATLVVVVVAAVGTYAASGRPVVPQVTPLLAWSVLPVGLVAGVALVNPGRASATSPDLGPVLLVAGCALALAVAALRPNRRLRLPLGLLGVAATAASLYGTGTVGGVPHSLQPWVLASFLVGPAGLVALLTGDDPAPARRAGTAADVVGGGVVWVLLFFAYYAGYDLGYRADAVIVAAAVALLALTALRGRGGTAAPSGTAAHLPWTAVAAVAAMALVMSAVGAVTHRVPDQVVATTSRDVSVVAYNVRMGYGMDGRFVPRDVAAVIGDADVVLLEEVDRGWLLNGGQDQLAILARLTGMRLYFAPAADPVWGDAILTRLPVSEVRGHPLPSHGAVTGAGMLAVRVNVDADPLWVVATHVQPTGARADGTVDQALDLAAVAAGLGADGTPVVLGGDFNFQPDEPSFAAILDAGFTDALAARRPVPTSESVDPVDQIDHVFVRGPVRAGDGGATRTTASDHLPVWVHLTLR